MQIRAQVRVAMIALTAVAGAALYGCASAKVTPAMVAKGSLPKPDMIVVENFAVTPAEVKLDEGVMATALRDSKNGNPSEEENRVGHIVADRLAQTLVGELRGYGISAVRSNAGYPVSATTAIISGQFVTIDQGNQSARVWVGFGMGGSELRTRIQVEQGNQLVAISDTATKASMKPGMVMSAGSAAVAGSAVPLAVGAGGAAISESVLATIQADADRTAKEVAKKIRNAYADRGWL